MTSPCVWLYFAIFHFSNISQSTAESPHESDIQYIRQILPFRRFSKTHGMIIISTRRTRFRNSPEDNFLFQEYSFDFRICLFKNPIALRVMNGPGCEARPFEEQSSSVQVTIGPQDKATVCAESIQNTPRIPNSTILFSLTSCSTNLLDQLLLHLVVLECMSLPSLLYKITILLHGLTLKLISTVIGAMIERGFCVQRWPALLGDTHLAICCPRIHFPCHHYTFSTYPLRERPEQQQRIPVSQPPITRNSLDIQAQQL